MPEDICPMCYYPWSNFVQEPAVAVILPCEHATCAKCLLGFQKKCSEPPPDNGNYFTDFSCEFNCAICRYKLPQTLANDIAHEIINKKLISSFNELMEKLPFTKEDGRNVLVRLLVDQHEFDINKVEKTLFNLVGLLPINVNEDMDHEKKQEYLINIKKISLTKKAF